MTASHSGCDDARLMGAPRTRRGGGGWRTHAARAISVALVAAAVLSSFASPARADDPLTEALKRKEELERAVQVARQNTQRYQTAAGQFQAAINAANARIAALAGKQAANQFQAAVDNANARISELADQQAAAQTEAESLGFQIQIAEEQLALVAFQLDETKALADSLKAQADEQTRQLLRRQELYARHLRTTYRQALVSPLEMLLGSSSLTEFASRLQAMIFVNRQDTRLANEIRALRADTARKQDEASAKEKEILGLQDEIGLTRQRLTVEKTLYDKLVADAEAAMDEQAQARAGAAADRNSAQNAARRSDRQRQDLQRQLDQAEAYYEQLAAAQAGKSGLGAFNGKLFMWPVRGPITSYFGPRWGGFHNGLDIAAPMYTPVRAPSTGVVTTVGRPYIASGDTAVVVIIAHGNNFATLSGHLADGGRWPPVHVGQRVAAGEIIGYIGMTGWTTGPHDHFMTIVDGRAQNPLSYLP